MKKQKQIKNKLKRIIKTKPKENKNILYTGFSYLWKSLVALSTILGIAAFFYMYLIKISVSFVNTPTHYSQAISNSFTFTNNSIVTLCGCCVM